jgi:hypothetical protein
MDSIKAELDAAKEHYLNEKARWKKAKEERRKLRKDGEAADEAAADTTRPPPIPGTFAPINPKSVSQPLQPAIPETTLRSPLTPKLNREGRVLKRMHDMGFSMETHPSLEELVSQHCCKAPESNTDDEVVANILEQLITTISPQDPSSSRVPGSW